MGCFLAPDLLSVFNAPLLYHHWSMSVSVWSSTGRYWDNCPGAITEWGVSPEQRVRLEWVMWGCTLTDGLQSYAACKDTVILVCCQTPALQPGWGIFHEVRCLGDDEGHVRKPISLYWLQRKPPVIRLDIDIKFLDGSLSHFNSLEDCSSHLKIRT